MSEEAVIAYTCPDCGRSTDVLPGVTVCGGCGAALPLTTANGETFVRTVPSWIDEAVGRWIHRLGVGEYEVRMHMSGNLEETDDHRVSGQATVQARYLRAALTFSTSLENDAYGQHVVAHEVGHILLGEIAAIVQHLIDQLPPRMQVLALEMWDDASDRTIERITRALERQGGVP